MTIIVKDYDLKLDMVSFTSLKYGIKIGFNLKTQVPNIAKIPDSVIKMNDDAMKSYERLDDEQREKIIRDMQEELKKEGWIEENKKQ
jgi:hypothetical protein